MGLFEAVLIGKSTIFGFVLFGGPILYICRNQINENLEVAEEMEEYAREFEEIEKEAKSAREILDDYSFKIFLPCNANGTGWILDYEIPEEGHYPRKWYIATNAHVANHFRFVASDYGQELPTQEIKKRADTPLFPNFPLNEGWSCQLLKYENYFDFNLSKQESGKELRSNFGAIYSGKMKEPKLFYAPIDFLKEVKQDNYSDFAVIEVEFATEGDAARATNNFYEKYGENWDKALNVFGTYSNKQTEEDSSDRVYSLGYQKQADPFKYTFSRDDYTTSRLARNSNGISDEEARVDASMIDLENAGEMTKWGNKRLNGVGYFYLLDNFAMGEGASGGLVIDSNRNVIGLRSLGSSQTDQTLVVPLRSSEFNNGSFKTPSFDLILGGFEKQTSSYREQVEKHILAKGGETWLSQRGKWKEALKNKSN